MKTQPLDDLEMFELLQACYPEKFQDDEDETFEAATSPPPFLTRVAEYCSPDWHP